MTNAELASALTDLADLMALEGGNDARRVAHYRGAATAIRRFEHPLADMIEAGIDLTQVPGIGKGLASFLEELTSTGTSTRLEEHRDRIPRGLLSVMRLDGVGPTRARTLWRDGGVEDVSQLRRAIAHRAVHGLDGFGPGVVSRIERGLAARAQIENRILISDADRALEDLRAALSGIEWRPAGEVARRTETVGRVEVVVATTPDTLDRRLRGKGSWSVTSPPGANPVELDLAGGGSGRLVATGADQLEAVAHHLTGPPAYLDALGDEASAAGLTLTPVGLTHGQGLAITAEGDMYEALDLPPVVPELREDRGTLERIRQGGAPDLITARDLRGDLHLHTTWSDGAASLERMVRAAAERGYAYLAITDHSPSTGAVSGLDGDALASQAEEIGAVQEAFPALRILRGVEVDILHDGSLDLDDDVLAGLDVVVASVHSGFEMDEAAMTRRVIRAMENRFVQILGHPTGRKLGRRMGYPVNLPDLLDAARELDVAVEVNGNPRRLDLDASGLWHCRERGVNVVISSDAHSVARLDNVRHAVDQARRGWLEAHHVVNAREAVDILSWTRRRLG